MKKYFDANKSLWDNRTPIHFKSKDYDVQAFMQGKCSLNSTEIDLLSEVRGKKILHLQCHFGLDSLSLARMGAQVTGVDFSSESIKTATDLNKQLGLDANFICCNIYDLDTHLQPTQQFDMVFTSYGVLCWLPDLKAWAQIISKYLTPDGTFYMVEFHPALMMLNFDNAKFEHSYFNTKKPIVEEQSLTYTDTPDNQKPLGTEYTWNHALDEIMGELLSAKLRLHHFKEYPFSHYDCFPQMIQENDLWYYKPYKNILPLMFSLGMSKMK
jgi:2-polyprenyl-3-methyl-5-hydroxy-6-metoxy-1,4-benzoquinol methylase